jgi:putative PIG3 family NAD(P)H quinone oxidoreductase
MTETMRCVEIAGKDGPPEVLKIAVRPRPAAGEDEVLIRVRAAGVNRPDVLQRQGGYPPPPGASDIPGLEVAGEIVELGAKVEAWKVGDPVCALVTGGGYAEYVAAPAPQCLPIPKGLSLVEAAGLPETFFTVWTNVFERGRLQAGETLLVHGGSSGIGTTAIQMASRLGAKVFATAGSRDKCAACERLGAAKAINYRETDFAEAVKALTDGKGVDVILDMVGADYVERNIRCLATEGRLVQIGFQKGSKVEINFMPLMLKRLTYTGSTLRIQSVASKGRMARALHARVWPLIESGAIRPVVHATFALERAAEAHRLMESNAHIGKIILTT